jgi:glutamate racemase
LDSPVTRRILERALQPMLEHRIDTVVLGCTHYPFVIPLIREIVGSEVRVIDPAPAVVRQIGRLLDMHDGRNTNSRRGWMRFFTSGSGKLFRNLLPTLLGEIGEVNEITWRGSEVHYFGASNSPSVP